MFCSYFAAMLPSHKDPSLVRVDNVVVTLGRALFHGKGWQTDGYFSLCGVSMLLVEMLA